MTRHHIATLVLCAASAWGCGSARKTEPLTGPIRLGSALSAQGQKVFMRNCNPCHVRGEAGVGPAINDKPLPGFMVRMQVRSGLGAMPAFSDEEIPPEDLDGVVAYLKDMRRQE